MNFRRYHVSKNLFDKTSEYVVGTNTYNYTISGLNPNKYYTCSTNFEKTAATASIYFGGGSSDNNGVWSNTPRTFKPDANGKIIVYIRFATSAGAPAIYDDLIAGTIWVMVNEGSTPQPYEPYSSEVWHDIPYYQHKTATDTLTLPAVIYPNDTSITVGIKGNTTQSGTPRPSNPVDVNGTGDMSGNLFDVNSVTLGKWYTNSGMLQSQPYGAISTMQEVTAEKYTIKWYGFKPYSISYVWFDSNKDFISRTHHGGSGGLSDTYTDTAPSNAAYFILQMSNGTDTSTPITIEQLKTYQTMFNTGITALSYEPYGYKIPILNNSQTTNVYLGEVQSTRRIKKYVFTGEESGTIYSTSTSRKGIEITGITGIIGGNADIAILAICTHYQPNTRTVLYKNTDNGISNAYQNDSIIFYDANYQTVEAFQQFCSQQYSAGTPVCVWYVLAEPTTAIVNEPLRKIGDYADEVSGITIPTIAGENTVDVDTTLKPSEVNVTYHGWHPVQNVHERENGAWT